MLGNERSGIEDEVLRLLDHAVEIPVYGLPYAHNAATAGAMALYEYCRQYPRLGNALMGRRPYRSPSWATPRERKPIAAMYRPNGPTVRPLREAGASLQRLDDSLPGRCPAGDAQGLGPYVAPKLAHRPPSSSG